MNTPREVNKPNRNKEKTKKQQRQRKQQQQQQQQHLKKNEEFSSHSLTAIKDQVALVRQELLSPLQPLSLPLADWSVYNDLEQRHALFLRTSEILDVLEQSVERGTINPLGKNGREVSVIGAMLLNFFSSSHANYNVADKTIPKADNATPNKKDASVSITNSTRNNKHRSGPTAFDQCQRLLTLLDQWNLSRLQAHYHYAVLAAVHEERWKEAADLYWQQIDSKVSGYSPVNISVASPVGLYAIARAAQQSSIRWSRSIRSESTDTQQQQEQQQQPKASVVERVMNAVINHLSLISPSDQDKCTFCILFGCLDFLRCRCLLLVLIGKHVDAV